MRRSGFCCFFCLAIWLSLLSYSSTDPSWNTAAETLRVHNLLGRNGAVWSDIFLQIFGLSIFLLPIHLALLGWKWVRNRARACGHGFEFSEVWPCGSAWLQRVDLRRLTG
jgi:DNA segregation ATPase FtsK/SpoIIIE-like protein